MGRINWGFILDGRIGHSHLQVPGPDGNFGFGGSCFPKDMRALIAFAKENNIPLNTIEGAWKTNRSSSTERLGVSQRKSCSR